MTHAVVRESIARWQSNRLLVGALIVSLALNLVIIGTVAGALWRHPAHPRTIIPNLLGFTNTLPIERRKELWEITADARRELRPFRREVRLAREEILKALVADPFDKDKFAAAQQRLDEAETRARPAVHKLYATLASHLRPDERLGFKRWRDHLRPPGSNLLDEPDQQAKEPR
jgi:uncharacterized membrane protein